MKNDQGIMGGLCSEENQMATRPKLHQHTFNHLQHLVHKIKDRAATRHDAEISNDADLLGSLLLLFVEEFILEGSITSGHVTPHS